MNRDAMERRKHARHLVGNAHFRSSDMLLFGNLYDLSLEGIGVEVAGRLLGIPETKVWTLTAHSPSFGRDLEFRVRVLRASEEGHVTRLGCEIVFMQESTFQALRRFCEAQAAEPAV